jgi:hypothetical protein
MCQAGAERPAALRLVVFTCREALRKFQDVGYHSAGPPGLPDPGPCAGQRAAQPLTAEKQTSPPGGAVSYLAALGEPRRGAPRLT